MDSSSTGAMDSLTKADCIRLADLCDRLEEKINDIAKKDDEIEDMCDMDDMETEVEAACTEMSELKAGLRKVERFIKTRSSSSSGGRTGTASGCVQLPRLDIPTFAGDQDLWTTYSELFSVTVHHNDSISDVERMQYLVGSLRGEALKVVSSLPMTGTNYSTAWDLLVKRYGNKRAIVRAHIHNIVTAPHVKNDDTTKLRDLWQTVQENILALRTQGIPISKWDAILIYLMSEKMDSATRQAWELKTSGTGLQVFTDLENFMDGRVRALESIAPKSNKSSNWKGPSGSSSKSGSSNKVQSYHTSSQVQCPACNKESHPLHQCSKFMSMDVVQRCKLVNRSKLCYNCLKSGHLASKCLSKHRCRDCQGLHHTSIHQVKPAGPVQQSQSGLQPATQQAQPDLQSRTQQAQFGQQQVVNPPVVTSAHGVAANQVLLPTAIVSVADGSNSSRSCRAMLDSGSQLTFITEPCFKRLRLSKQYSPDLQITGIGQSAVGRTKGTTTLTINSGDAKINCDAVIVSHLTSQLPNQPVQLSNWRSLINVNLADPEFDKPADVDLLLGNDVYDQIVLDSRKQIDDKLFIRDTVFGWIVSGVAVGKPGSFSSHATFCNPDALLRRFWEIEEPNVSADNRTDEQIACEDHYDSTTKRDDQGRFVVSLPRKPGAPKLGHSFRQAERRFFSVERKLMKRPDLHKQYRAVTNEYLDMGHMEEVPSHELHKPYEEVFYLPHHHVVKETSTTTKLRIVFDGSLRTAGGPSLNDTLMIGPVLQDTLTELLIRSRFHRVALSADIAKMYRQLLLADREKDFHRLVWKEDPNQPLKIYRMTRVTFGITSSPYHAIRSVQEAAKDAPKLIKDIIINDLYVDDLCSGASSEDQAIEIQDGLNEVLAKSGFDLRKWSSNNASLVQRLPEELRESKDELVYKDEFYNVKTLGVKWKPNADTLSLATHDLEPTCFTKRALLSDSSSFFDPLGWISPTILQLKCLMQQTWVAGVDWDDQLPNDIMQAWMVWREDFKALDEIQLPRCVLASGDSREFQLHVFTDASEIAFGAVAYSRVVDVHDNINVQLLAAKTKVAPVKTVSLPRLELCAAQLGIRLLHSITGALRVQPDAIFAPTDSTVVLAWLSKIPKTWSTFVANRVSFIQDVLPAQHWRHVDTNHNPADCASRSLRPRQLPEHKLWWNDLEWLSGPQFNWPSCKMTCDEPPEQRSKPHPILQCNVAIVEVNKYSSWSRLKRVTAWCFRFINNIKRARVKRKMTDLDNDDLDHAECYIIRNSQQEFFADDYSRLSAGKPISASSKLVSLAPFLDEATGVIHVGGRIQHASGLATTARHPILVSNNDPLVNLIVRYYHDQSLHAGNQATLAHTRCKFWILRGRDVVRRIIIKCVKCRRFNASPLHPRMADLPASRVTVSRPFTITGLDFGGPLVIKLSSNRKAKTSKAYIALFVCFSTKAVPLELVSGLSTEAFKACLRRFISRRGLPNTIHSDNGTNFVGAASKQIAGRTKINLDKVFIQTSE